MTKKLLATVSSSILLLSASCTGANINTKIGEIKVPITIDIGDSAIDKATQKNKLN